MNTENSIIKKLKSKWNTASRSRDNSIELEIEKRIPIWNAISEFYLDIELQNDNYESIINTFLNSELHISELKEIDLYEVFPVLKGNLISVTGEWNGFDEKWLSENCKKSYLKRKSKFFKWKVRLYNKFLYSMRKEHWDEIENRMKIYFNNL